MAGIRDTRGRLIDYARISVTDRCNYRCRYCMPEDGVPLLGHDEILRYEEILWLCAVLRELGVRKIRFTGGEPLVRKGFVPFLSDFRERFPDMALSITTNASLLLRYAEALAAVSLSGMNVSLDTVDAEKFREITRGGSFADVAAGIDAALACGIPEIKTNTVLIRGFNEAELPDILAFAWSRGITPRLIEFMPLGDDVWSDRKFVHAREMMRMLACCGTWRPETGDRARSGAPLGPAKYYVDEATGRRVGVIEAVSEHFCSRCNRLRITAAGNLRACLFRSEEIPLLDKIRARDGEAVKKKIREGVNAKPGCWEEARDGAGRMSGIGG